MDRVEYWLLSMVVEGKDAMHILLSENQEYDPPGFSRTEIAAPDV